MSASLDHDVLIAGAGPAGAHLALRLAQRGWSVALLDAKTFPRPKPCGEFLSPECLGLLDELDLLAPLLEAGAARVGGMRLHGAERAARGRYRTLGGYGMPRGRGVGIRREVLDLQAVELAARTPGVRMLLGWHVSKPLVEGQRCVGLAARDPDGHERELRARFTVGADGVRSRVARGLGWSAPPGPHARYAVVARFEGVPALDDAEVHLFDGEYFAACPIDAGLFTANLVVDRDALLGTGGRERLRALFEDRLRRAPALAERLADAHWHGDPGACGPLGHRTSRCAGPGAALVGDAAGFVDPLTGEGLYFAMRGAKLLAAALDAALCSPQDEPRALTRYVGARRRELGPRYALARLLQRGIRSRRVVGGVLGLFERFPAACDVLLGLTGDYVPPRGLVLPRVWRSARAPEVH